MLAIGSDNFTSMLAGFNEIDEHFRTAPFERNLPVLLALLFIACGSDHGGGASAQVTGYTYDAAGRLVSAVVGTDAHGPGGIAQLIGPTAGYLFSYPLAAAVAAGVVRIAKAGRAQFSGAMVAGVAASAVIFTMGAGWFAVLLHLSPGAAWHMGVAPFLPYEVLKIAAAAGAYTSLRRWRQF